MNAPLKFVKGNTLTIELKVKLSNSMLETEENILSSLNEAGCIATSEALSHFDTEGSKLVFGKTFYPMERDARIVTTSTPHFAKGVCNKMACGATSQVRRDLLENQGPKVTRMYIGSLSER